MDKILILDFGSQYTQLIARRIREEQVYSEIHPFSFSIDEIKAFAPKGIVLSGGPSSVYDANAPKIDLQIFKLGIPILGICYGMQLLSREFGGNVARGKTREYGRAVLQKMADHPLFDQIPDESKVWMSHGDEVLDLPEGFRILGRSENGAIAAVYDNLRQIYGLQFHPEVTHTEFGSLLIRNFIFKICQAKKDWTMPHFIDAQIAAIREQVGSKRAICATSGGVDSTVAAEIVHRAIGDQLICILVDNGLMRKNEREKIESLFGNHLKIPLQAIDASDVFLTKLAGVADPEQKRKIIGNTFIEIFEEQAEKISDVVFLVQGTLYPDVIESVSFKGPSATIKTHHNVGGLPEKMGLKLIEPLRELFKDEVRALGRALGIPETFIRRQPFPGPGLAIRVLGEVTPERLVILRQADEIVLEEIKKAGYYDRVWQSFAVLLPIQTVGVMGDERTYENVIALRCVTSLDGMTADWTPLPLELLARLSNRIINEVRGVNRVVYDISSKPPATIEWE